MSKSLHKRLRFFTVVVVLVTLVLTGRLFWLQIYKYDYYVAEAENNRLRELPIMAARGEIMDRNGVLLATNRPGFAVSLLDWDKSKGDEIIGLLSRLLEIPETEIRKQIERQQFKTFAPIRIATDVSAEVVARITERRPELPGVIIEAQPVREYPLETVAAHVLGYMGAISSQEYQEWGRDKGYRITDNIGKYGLEAAWEEYLRGQDGVEVVETNFYGQRVRELGKINPVAGHNLVTTLDTRLQRIAEEALAGVISELREGGNEEAGKGAVVAMDPGTGQILAMVSLPAYNPNSFYDDYSLLISDSNHPLINKAISGMYPVGSTFKMAVATAGLEEGIISRNTILYCSGRKVYFAGEAPRGCHLGIVHGAVNVTRALQVSCNSYFFELGKRTGIDLIEQYARNYTLGKKTGLQDLAGEAEGTLLCRREGEPWYPGNVLTASIGQGHAITPLQLANYAAIIANQGTHYRPYLVQKVVSPTGKVVLETEPEVLNRLDYAEATWQAVREGMEMVAMPGGTGSVLRNLPVKVAAKTGSAEAGTKEPHSLFVGYAPADNPEIALAVIVEHGGLGYQGAVPVAHRILAEYYGDESREE